MNTHSYVYVVIAIVVIASYMLCLMMVVIVITALQYTQSYKIGYIRMVAIQR